MPADTAFTCRQVFTFQTQSTTRTLCQRKINICNYNFMTSYVYAISELKRRIFVQWEQDTIQITEVFGLAWNGFESPTFQMMGGYPILHLPLALAVICACYFGRIWIQLLKLIMAYSDNIWCRKSGPTLAQVMTCFLTAPNHYLNQNWLIIKAGLWLSPDSNFTRNARELNT